MRRTARSAMARGRTARRLRTWSDRPWFCTMKRAKRSRRWSITAVRTEECRRFLRSPTLQLYDIAEFLHMRVELAANRGLYQVQNVVTGNARGGRGLFRRRGQMRVVPFGHRGPGAYRIEAAAGGSAAGVPISRRARYEPARPDAGDRDAGFRADDHRHAQAHGRLPRFALRCERANIIRLRLRGRTCRWTWKTSCRRIASCWTVTPMRICTILRLIW